VAKQRALSPTVFLSSNVPSEANVLVGEKSAIVIRSTVSDSSTLLFICCIVKV